MQELHEGVADGGGEGGVSDRTRALRYKRPALASMGAEMITAELDTIKEIESLYDEMNSGDYTSQRIAEKKFDRLLETLPERAWLE